MDHFRSYTPAQILALAEAIDDRMAWRAGVASEPEIAEPRRMPPPCLPPLRAAARRGVPPPVPPPPGFLDLGSRWYPW